MRTFEEKKQCEEWIGHKMETCCIQSDLPCKADSCPSRRYHKNHPQLNWHDKHRVLNITGLEDEYKIDMEES